MAPIRRYLRITKYSVLECRIYLDNPALAESWLLNSRNPVLPRIIECVRPFVLPKLREENERSKKKGGSKKKAVKDVVAEEDFEVSIFLTEISTRHSILTKQKHFKEPNKKSMQSNSSKLTGDTHDTAIEVEDAPVIRREDSEDDGLHMLEIPVAEEDGSDAGSLFVSEDEGSGRTKRPRTTNHIDSDSDSESAFPGRSKRRKADLANEESTGSDDKKKLAMNTTYEGFSIYGRALCLIVKRKDNKGKGSAPMGGQAMIQDWISSTQMPPQEDE